MKVKSILYEVISGSVGSLTGAMGLGGAYLKEKPSPNNPQTALQVVIRDAMKNANSAWLVLDVAVKELWNIYGKTLTYTNSTGHIVKQTGWTAFNASFVLMTQAGMSVAALSVSPPTTTGYLTSPSFDVVADVGGTFYGVITTSVIDMQISIFTSPLEKNTINTNTKGYRFQGNQLMNPSSQMNLNADIQGGRFFFKARRIELDGGMSLETVITKDLVTL